MIPKFYKRLALGFVLFVCIIVPFCFWLGGWDFERNATGIGCVVMTLVISAFGGSMIMCVGSENKEE
jgi:hypothetical protein